MGTNIYLEPTISEAHKKWQPLFVAAVAERDLILKDIPRAFWFKANSDKYINSKARKAQRRVSYYYNKIYSNSSYIRASIGMILENEVLRMIFPNEFWNPEDDKPLVYNFIQNRKALNYILKKYLLAVATGKASIGEVPEEVKAGAVFGMMFAKEFGGSKGPGQVDVGQPDQNHSKIKVVMTLSPPQNEEGLKSAKWWANGVRKFFRNGLKLQNEGQNPTVAIGW